MKTTYWSDPHLNHKLLKFSIIKDDFSWPSSRLVRNQAHSRPTLQIPILSYQWPSRISLENQSDKKESLNHQIMAHPARTLLCYSPSTDVAISYDTVLHFYGSQVNIANLITNGSLQLNIRAKFTLSWHVLSSTIGDLTFMRVWDKFPSFLVCPHPASPDLYQLA